MTVHICRGVKKNCWNPYDSYGEICVGCGCCSDDPLERAKARLAVSEEHLQRDIEFDQWSDDPEWRAIQEKNRKANIKYNRRRVYYYRKRMKDLEANEWDEYDYCYECRGLGDDYIINDDGELESWCDKCGVNPDRR